MADRAKTKPAIQCLFTMFGVQASVPMWEGYFVALADLSDEAVAEACAVALRECRHMPRPAELRSFVKPSDSAMAVLAFETMRRAIGRHGIYQSVDFEDKAINATIRSMGGWLHVCNMSREDFEVWGKKEFEKHYAIWSKYNTEEQARYLPGSLELENVPKGYAAPEVKRIAGPSSERLKLAANCK